MKNQQRDGETRQYIDQNQDMDSADLSVERLDRFSVPKAFIEPRVFLQPCDSL